MSLEKTECRSAARRLRRCTPGSRAGKLAGRNEHFSTLPLRSPVRSSTLVAARARTLLYFASRGQRVTGIDFLEEPIRLAKQKASERSLTATFLVMDALCLQELPEVFDNVIDSGLFHVFGDDDRRRYVEGWLRLSSRAGRFFFLCFSDENPARPSTARFASRTCRSLCPAAG